MSSAPAQLAALRQLIADRWPTAPRSDGSRLATELPAIDDATDGGLPAAAVTEVVCAAPSCGGHLLLGQLLAVTRRRHQRCVLIDPADCFDPGSHPAAHLEHLVWARGGDTATALAVADLFARDANLGLVLLDLRRAPDRELRRIPAPLWYRLQRAVEETALVLLVLTPRILIPSARLRLELPAPHAPATLQIDRPDLLPGLCPRLSRHRRPESHRLSA